MQGGFVQRQPMDRRPEIQDVPLGRTLRVEAPEDVLAQVDREGPLRVAGVAVHRTGATALLAAAAQLRQQAQMLKHLFHVTCSRKKAKSTRGRAADGGGSRLDRRDVGLYGGGGRGDHFPRGQVPLVAHGSCLVLAEGVAAGARDRRAASLTTAVVGGILPGEVLRVEGAIGLPDGEDEVEQLAHAMADGDVAALALGLEAAIEGADGGVVADGGPGGIPEVARAPDRCLCGDMCSVPGGKGWPCLSTPELFSSGKTPK